MKRSANLVYNLETPDKVNSAIKSLRKEVIHHGNDYIYDFLQYNSFLVIKVQVGSSEQLNVAVNYIFPKAEQIDAGTRLN